MTLSAETTKILLLLQKNELTESIIYSHVADYIYEPSNAEILRKISRDEQRHSETWYKYTKIKVEPNKFKILLYTTIARILGFTFTLKYMENNEAAATVNYDKLKEEIPEAISISEQEQHHEKLLLEMLNEDRLNYIGAMVLGLSDALVELTGTLAGMTFALTNTRLVALSALITGIAATLSMASSQFLSARAEGKTDALKSCTYTGIAYLIAVSALALPYLVLPNEYCYWALAWMLGHVIIIIAAFTSYLSVIKNGGFKQRFCEMAGVSLGVAVLSFGVGLLVKYFLGIEC